MKGLLCLLQKEPRSEKHKGFLSRLEKKRQYYYLSFVLDVLAFTQDRQGDSLLPDTGLQDW